MFMKLFRRHGPEDTAESSAKPLTDKATTPYADLQRPDNGRSRVDGDYSSQEAARSPSQMTGDAVPHSCLHAQRLGWRTDTMAACGIPPLIRSLCRPRTRPKDFVRELCPTPLRQRLLLRIPSQRCRWWQVMNGVNTV